MNPISFQNLSRRERQIMELFFENGPLSANQIIELLPDNPSNATVRTLLRILEDKGQLLHEKEGRQFIYFPVKQHADTSKNVFKDMLKTFFKGSLTDAVATFINDPESEMTSEELDELEALVKKAKQK